MSELDRHDSNRDLTYDRSQPGKYIPFESVDKELFDIIHPENAMMKLGMSARTAYRKIDSGDIEYTLDKGSKRILVRKDQTRDDNMTNSVSHLSFVRQNQSDNMSDFPNISPAIEKILDSLPNYKEMLVEKDEEIRQLRDEIDILKTRHQEALDTVRQKCQTEIENQRSLNEELIGKLREEMDNLKLTSQRDLALLKEQLETERIQKARMEGDIKRIASIESTVDAQKETIFSQKSTIEALNNERIVITQQLQKYRGQDDPSLADKLPFWMFWKSK